MIGDHVMFGGQVGVGRSPDDRRPGESGGKVGDHNSVDADAFVSGYPAIDNGEWRRRRRCFEAAGDAQQLSSKRRLEDQELKAKCE